MTQPPGTREPETVARTAGHFLRDLWELLGILARRGRNRRDRWPRESGAYVRLLRLLAEDPTPEFHLAAGSVLYHDVPLDADRAGPWPGRLAARGHGILAFRAGVTQEEFGAWIDHLAGDLHTLLATPPDRIPRTPHIRSTPRPVPSPPIGRGRGRNDPETVPGSGETGTLAVVRHLWESAARRGRVPETTAGEVVDALRERLSGPEPVVSLLRHPEPEGYLPRHAVNVSVLAMALARFLGHDAADVRAVGKAALVHNVGQTALPRSILEKRGALDPEEWEVVRDHPRLGAEILAPWADELPARVSREHHVTRHGGYPDGRVPAKTHPASRIVQICDVYEALCSPRPYRDAWRVPRALEFLRRRSGTHFDPVFVTGFQRMGRLWLRRVFRSETDGSDAELEFGPAGDSGPLR